PMASTLSSRKAGRLAGDWVNVELSSEEVCSRCSTETDDQPASPSSSSMSFTLGILRISVRANFHARWTTHESDRSRRAASSLISWSIISGEYKLCLRLSLPDRFAVESSATSLPQARGRTLEIFRYGNER